MSTKHLMVVFLSLVLTACQDPSIRNRASSLDTALSEYNIGLRWSMIDVIEHYHNTKEGRPELIDRDALSKIRVTDTSILKQTVNDEVTEAEVLSEVSYYATDSGRLKKMKFTHNWWYDEEKETWFIESDYLDFE